MMKKSQESTFVFIPEVKKLFLFLAFSIPFSFVFSSVLFSQDTSFFRNKINGMLIGTALGDALGGPIEFQSHADIQKTPFPPYLWVDTTQLMDEDEIMSARDRIFFREYKYLRPIPEPYGHWGYNSAAGTVTDDTRHKIILMFFLRDALVKNSWPVTEKDYAQSYLAWSGSEAIHSQPGYDTLCAQWLDESYKVINWILGSREPFKAYPPERLWNALPTCYGQMALLPLAAVYPGEPLKAYLAAYELAWFENGFARDMISSLVAGLSVALTLNPENYSDEELWNEVFKTMLETDPYAYSSVPWSERAVVKWLNLASEFAEKSGGSPARLFMMLDNEFRYSTKWEAQVPFTIIFSVLKLCQYDPLAALQLSIEWGWDHDSYAQLLGAFIGALYGEDLFKEEWQGIIKERLQEDYNEDISEWTDILIRIQEKGRVVDLFIEKH